ncbi:hypothetical protein Tco_0743751, partial [Tanacetum coccineum]
IRNPASNLFFKSNRDLSSKTVAAAAARNSKDTNGYFLLLVLQRLKDGLLLVYKVVRDAVASIAQFYYGGDVHQTSFVNNVEA